MKNSAETELAVKILNEKFSSPLSVNLTEDMKHNVVEAMEAMIAFKNEELASKDEMLKLAGKLALTAHLVVTSNAIDLSKKIEAMNDALLEYDNHVFKNIK